MTKFGKGRDKEPSDDINMLGFIDILRTKSDFSTETFRKCIDEKQKIIQDIYESVNRENDDFAFSRSVMNACLKFADPHFRQKFSIIDIQGDDLRALWNFEEDGTVRKQGE